MNSLIKHLILCITFLAVSTGVSAEEVNKKDPYQMIKTVADITFKRFANEQAAIQVEPNLLKTIVREELMPYINYQYAAYKVIGSNFKKTNKTERAEFVPAFREYLITSYAQVFTLYNNQKVEFAPPKDFTDERVVSVATSVLEPGRPPIDISFRVRKHKKTGDWKAYDMVAEGISLLDSKQAELSSLIRQKGLSHVTEMLKEKSQKNIEFKQ
ncbi:ABC transporter substrate-binding protein [Colwellia sp. 6M3]|jgi:phospholipid transport system substrate-binding protein|uniref:MlaC/ttg2D family ABC transporter substrate-binding protein n=1 Tax=Colwellia sp. 6M3 TaxID=2759849 RepID=UPI0015F76DD3|nr:ABC transporter substrate-binding protein [Colwellia sp. 6M3]MBA6414624.1 ABC transporter substrate-binding protein [Colwellia sp. 6M3]|tara:strand:- start:4379 stop:5017 length:639 start_codon:yes stop_codon:yes gene_type:complete